jgi:hypothetical protein
MIEELVENLESQLPELEQRRASDSFANDVYEAADYWCDLARWALEKNTRVNYPVRARGELVLLGRLRQILQTKSEESQRKYAPLFETATAILMFVEKVQPPKDGHLGVLRIIREQFGFLQTDYGFVIAEEEPTSVRLSSSAVYVKLEYASRPYLSCQFGPQSDPTKSFGIDDLLFMNGDERYRDLPQELKLDTERDVENWFKFLGDIFRQYLHDVLSNRPGIFEQLGKSQAQRDQEYIHDMNRQHGLDDSPLAGGSNDKS